MRPRCCRAGRFLVLVALGTVLPLLPLGAAGATAASTPAAGPTCQTVARAGDPPLQATTPRIAAPVLRTIADVPLPGGAFRFDYQSLDTTTGRLYIAHMGAGQVIAFDTETNRVVATVGGLPGVTGVLAVPELGRVYASVTGDHQVAVLDARSLRVVAHIGRIGFPDGLDYAPAAKRVYVSDESGGGELVIDAVADKAATTIDIGGEAGNTHYDPVSGCVVVAVQTRDQLVFIDPATDRLVARQGLDVGCQGPHGFLLDAPRRLAFVTCEDNARMLVVDLRTRRVLATHPVGDGPDVLAFDPGWRYLYVASESGVVAVFAERGTGLDEIGRYTAPAAHSIAVAPATHRVYLPLANVGGRPILRIMVAAPPTG